MVSVALAMTRSLYAAAPNWCRRERFRSGHRDVRKRRASASPVARLAQTCADAAVTQAYADAQGAMIYQTYQAHVRPDVAASHAGEARAAGVRSARATCRRGMRAQAGRRVRSVRARATLTHQRPPFGIDSVTVGEREVAVHEEAALATPFGTLLHFASRRRDPEPRVLLVAPMSGHFATLLRETARTMLRRPRRLHHRLAQRARRAAHGRALRPRRIHRAHDRVPRGDRPRRAPVAVCQPCVAALAAVAIMAEDDASRDAAPA